MADIVGQDDEISFRIQQLARVEQLVGELRAEELRARAAGAVRGWLAGISPVAGAASTFPNPTTYPCSVIFLIVPMRTSTLVCVIFSAASIWLASGAAARSFHKK